MSNHALEHLGKFSENKVPTRVYTSSLERTCILRGVVRVRISSLEQSANSEKVLVGLNLRLCYNSHARADQQHAKGFARASKWALERRAHDCRKILRAHILRSSAGFLTRVDCKIFRFFKTGFELQNVILKAILKQSLIKTLGRPF